MAFGPWLKRWQGPLCLAGAAFCLGWIGVFMRRIQATPAPTVVFYRATLALLALALLVRPRALPRGWRVWRAFLGFGALQAATYLFYLSAYRYTSVANAAFLHYLAPVFVLLLAPLALGERVGKRILLALLPALAGTLLLTGADNLLHNGLSLGDLLAICSALTYAGYTLLGRGTGRTTGALHLALWVHLVAAGCVGLFNLAVPGGGFAVAPGDWAFVVLLALVSTTAAFILFFKGLQSVPASRATLVMLLSPVTNALLAWLILKEALTPPQIFGAGLIVVAAALAARRAPAEPLPPADTLEKTPR